MTVCGLVRLDGADVRRSTLTGMLAASSIGLPAARRVHLDGPFGVVAAADTAAGSIPPVVVSSTGLVVVMSERLRWGGPRQGRRGRQRIDVGGRPGGAVAEVVPLSRDPGSTPDSRVGSASMSAPNGRPTELRRPSDHETHDLRAPGQDVQVIAAAVRAYRAAGHSALAMVGDHLLAIVWEPARRRMVVSRGGRRAEELVIWSDGRYFAFGAEPGQVLAARPGGPARLRWLDAGETVHVTVATRLRRPLSVELPEPRSGEADIPAT